MPRRAHAVRLLLVLAGLVAVPMLATSVQAQAVEDPEDETAQAIDAADPDADPGDSGDPGDDTGDGGDPDDGDAADDSDPDSQVESGQTDGADGLYEPDQRGYEPDQRGYEPDQRGGHEPPPGQPSPAPMMQEQRVELTGGDAGSDESESIAESGGRGIGFDVSLFLGAGLTSLESIGNDNLVRGDQQGGFGGSFGVAGAVRLGPVSLGPRVAVTVDPSFVLAHVGLDLGAVLLPEPFAPTVRASASFVLLTGPADALPSQGAATGVQVELGVGFRWLFYGPVYVAAEVSGGYLHLERGAVPAAMCEAPCSDGDFDLARSGTSDGLTLRLHLSTGVRF